MYSSQEQINAAAYRERIIDEVCYALGVGRSGVMRRLLGPLFRRPASRFGRISAGADEEVDRSGLSGGARRILSELNMTVSARRADLIPADGPLLIASNHPGALDSIAILSSIPRKDVSVLLSDVPFTRAFSAARRHFIYVPKKTGGRGATLRVSIDHLKNGGALLVFAHGDVEPDPEVSPGAVEAIQDWSRSIEIMLREVPECRLLVTIASGVLVRRFLNGPIVRVRKTPARRQKLAEVLQLCRQAISPRSVRAVVHISFSKPVTGKDLIGDEMMSAVIKIARELLEDHLAALQAHPHRATD
ncbi:MAG: hypothetical protein JXE07_08855 [Candidatus Aminicenantes bacterium]|nr:hypothetical protein [Candidatus Aminicenantes bacterium]